MPERTVLNLGQLRLLSYKDPDAGSSLEGEASAGGLHVIITVIPEANGVVLGGLVCVVLGTGIGCQKLFRRRALAIVRV